jgi:hypothetical protein
MELVFFVSIADIQLGILAELLTTFRLCLNDKNARVIHVALNALRTLLPVLLTNSEALTIIAMELLEDAIQHSSSSYVLAKVEMKIFMIEYLI